MLRKSLLCTLRGASDLSFKFASKLEASKRLGHGRGASYLESSLGMRLLSALAN
jgi:hypothetical protein